MQFALAIFNVPVFQIALECQKKRFEKKAIGFDTKESVYGKQVCNQS